MNKIFPLIDFLYLLQIEEYNSKRYFKLLSRFFLRRNFQKRGSIVYTTRIKTTLLFALIPSILFFPLTPIWVGLANIILTPYFEMIKLNIQNKAAKYFSNVFNGKVIAIAGSYGKTTTKNYIFELIRFNYKTQMIPGNINTPTGIANWVLNKLRKDTEILIVEMDTYFIGEIARSCKITPPDIAILTNTADQHLERFGSRKNLINALNEIFKFAKPNAIKISGKKSNFEYALEVAKILKIPPDITKDTAKKLKKPDRRGDFKNIFGYTVIDESYNICEETAIFGLKNAINIAKKENKKLVVITAGIPELGNENKDANFKYAIFLKKSGVEVVILKSILCKDYINNLKYYKLAKDLKEAWGFITNNYKPNKYAILLQPELGDQYY